MKRRQQDYPRKYIHAIDWHDYLVYKVLSIQIVTYSRINSKSVVLIDLSNWTFYNSALVILLLSSFDSSLPSSL